MFSDKSPSRKSVKQARLDNLNNANILLSTMTYGSISEIPGSLRPMCYTPTHLSSPQPLNIGLPTTIPMSTIRHSPPVQQLMQTTQNPKHVTTSSSTPTVTVSTADVFSDMTRFKTEIRDVVLQHEKTLIDVLQTHNTFAQKIAEKMKQIEREHYQKMLALWKHIEDLEVKINDMERISKEEKMVSVVEKILIEPTGNDEVVRLFSSQADTSSKTDTEHIPPPNTPPPSFNDFIIIKRNSLLENDDGDNIKPGSMRIAVKDEEEAKMTMIIIECLNGDGEWETIKTLARQEFSKLVVKTPPPPPSYTTTRDDSPSNDESGNGETGLQSLISSLSNSRFTHKS